MSVLWGCSYLLIRIAVDGGMPAADVAWTRVGIAAVILLALSWRAGLLGSVAGRWRWLVAYAVVEIAIPFPLIAAGEVHVASSLAAILIAAVPLIGAVLALRFDHAERPTRTRAIGLGIGFAGVIALVGVDIAGSGSPLKAITPRVGSFVNAQISRSVRTAVSTYSSVPTMSKPRNNPAARPPAT